MSLREALLIATVVVVCCGALTKPRLGLMGYVWFALLRPDALAWVTDQYPFSLALAIATLAGSIRYVRAAPRVFTNWSSRLLLLLQVPLAASVVFSTGPFLSADRYDEYLRAMVMVLLIPVLFQSEKQLRHLLVVMACSIGFLGAKYGLYGLLAGGVVFTQDYSPQYDNNTLGMAFAMAVPLCWYSRNVLSSWWQRSVLMAMVLGSSAGTIMTNSRGASLALGAGFIYIVYQSKRKTALLLLLALAVGPAVYMLQDVYLDRMATLKDYNQEASAASRIDYAKAAFSMWMDHPILGVGFGSRNYAALSEKYLGRENAWHHGAHNSYMQMLVDSGILAFALYSTLLFGTILRLGPALRAIPVDRLELRAVPMALQTSLIVFAVGATFHSFQRYDFPYMVSVLAGTWMAVTSDAEVEHPVGVPQA